MVHKEYSIDSSSNIIESPLAIVLGGSRIFSAILTKNQLEINITLLASTKMTSSHEMIHQESDLIYSSLRGWSTSPSSHI